MYNLLYHRFLKFACKALNHDSVLVQSVFKYFVESCSNFIGYNFLYSSYHSRVYNDHERSCSQVVREIRSTHIHGFEQSELDMTIDSICKF